MIGQVAKESFKLNFWILNFFHLYLSEKKTKCFKLRAHVLYLTLMVPAPLLAILYLILEKNWDSERLKYNAPFMAQTIAFVFKFLPFLYNGEQLSKCLEICDISFLGVFKNKQKLIQKECIDSCKTNSLIFFLAVIGASLSWTVKPIFWTGRNLPANIWLPFEPTKNIIVFSIVYLFMVIGLLNQLFNV